MKKFKKLAALILAVVMVLSMTVTAYAAEGDPVTYSVTINNATGHKYVIYQIFTGDLATKDGKEVLSNIKYGADYTPDGVAAGTLVPEEVLNATGFDATKITPTGDGEEMTTSGDKATIDGLVAGYYLIKDITTGLPAGNTVSDLMFQVVDDTEITSKHTGTTIVKKVQDINDTTGKYTTAGEPIPDATKAETWIDSADYDIGDTVPFKSTATFEGMTNYKTYKVVFTDIMSPGLTYTPNSMKVYVNGADKTGSFVIETATYTDAKDPAYTGGTKITVTCDDITKLLAEGANDATIVLEYSATLNEKANLGAPGNPNKIKVTTKPDGTGDTPWDVNIVFTYKVEVDKYTTVDGKEVGLPNAGFTLYKEVANAIPNKTKTGAEIKAELTGKNPSIKATALKDDALYIVAAVVEVDKDGDTFGFEGIDDGSYVLVETTIPAGYNAWEAEAFDVVATHDVDSADPKLNTLTGGNLLTGDVDTGILKGEVENNSGTVLPETGGIGTTIFYVVGGVMVLAAIILLVTKKRMASAD